MSIDLYNLDPEELWKYDYNQTLAVVLAIETKLFNTTVGAETIEAVINYLECVSIITLRVEEYDFPEISKETTVKSPEASNSRQWLQLRLKMIFLSCKSFLDNARVSEDYSTKKAELENAITVLQEDLITKKNEIDSSLKAAQKAVDDKLTAAKDEMQDSEHNMLTHVLTLMGVFTAVITIIMSVVITSSSWLNNADGASAFFALAVPNLVAIFAVIVLVGLVFIYQNGLLSKPGKSKVVIWFLSGITALVLILTCLMGWCAISYTQPCKASQVHYVISSSEYSIKQEINSETGKKETYCVFVFEGESFKFPYDNKYIHDGNLYFCKEHRTLE